MAARFAVLWVQTPVPRGPMLHGEMLARAIWGTDMLYLCAPMTPLHSQPSQVYTVAFKSFAPNNSDIVVADVDGSHARPLAPRNSGCATPADSVMPVAARSLSGVARRGLDSL